MKTRLLFVDDEPNIIQGLKRSLFNMRSEWDMFFALSGEEALDIMSRNTIDVIITDMRMPEMDGAELLNRVRNLYPQVVRIILSGYSEQEMILRSVNVAHQFLNKPCDIEILKNTINQVLDSQSVLENELLVKLINGIDKLPSMPRLYNTLANEIKSPDTSLQKIGEIISRDPAMTAKILQMVNSAFFSLPQKITDPHQAVILLGIDNLRALLLYTHLFSILKEKPLSLVLMQDLWKHSLLVGSVAKEIAQTEWQNQQLAQTAFSAGILHDIGKLILLQIGDYWSMAKKWTNHDWRHCIEMEYEVLGTSHAEVGAYLLGLWGINESIATPVAYHHYPAKLTGNVSRVVLAVHVANGLSAATSSSDGAYDVNLDLKYLEAVNMIYKLPAWLDIYQHLLRSIGNEYE